MEVRRPRDERELAAALALREEVYVASRASRSAPTVTGATTRRSTSSPSTTGSSAPAGC